MKKGKLRTHGEIGTKPYILWRSIIQRCHGNGKKEFPNYKGRGIKMYEPWRTNFIAFRDYVTNLPHYGEEGMTLDRKNNDGNYEPGNLRWTDWTTQRINSRTRKDTNTGHRNIREGYKGKFRVSITRKGISISLGNNFTDLEEAIKARDNFINLRKPN